MPPRVSICLPNLNTIAYLPERVASILDQTFTDWELVVSDNESDDGAWEFFQDLARKDRRVSIAQAPRAGMYANWNNCLRRARGEFVYIATSDDTMAPDCLERMVEALDQHPECGLCHCALRIIDEAGAPVGGDQAWEHFIQQKYFGDWMQRPHVRRAPHDGLLHFGFFTVFTSLTQLLIRRRVFEEYGLYRTDCRSYADFEWGLRVALNESVVHVPLPLATWRVHPEQATQARQLLAARANGEFRRMTREALKAQPARNAALVRALQTSPLNDYYLVDEMKARTWLGTSPLDRAGKTAGFAARHPLFAARWLFTKLVLRRAITGEFGAAVRREMQRLGLANLLTESAAALPQKQSCCS